MALYPLYINLREKNVLVVGAGTVGKRKIRSLANACPHRIKVLDPTLDAAAIHELGRIGACLCEARTFTPDDLDGMFLVFAATGSKETNNHIADLCREKGILCNCIDAPGLGDCIVPAHFSQNGLSLALSTSGQSPALARHIRKELEEFIGSRYTALLGILARLRPHLLALGLPTEKNTEIFRSLLESSLQDHLARGDTKAATSLLQQLLPVELHSRLGEILHGH